MRKTLFKVLRVTATIIALVILVVGAGYLWLARSLPDSDGEVAVAGLRAGVEIRRDDDGIVTILAETEEDAAFALGYAHAQDRLWQMDFMRRTGAGRLSEVVGAGALPIDRFMRTLGLYRLAEANLQHLDTPLRATLEAYAAGVNGYLEARSGPLPPAFLLLGYKPEPWRPADSLVWGRLMAVQLSNNWRDEISRFRLDRKLTPEQISVLWPDAVEGDFITLGAADEARTMRLAEDLADLLPWSLAPKDASNSWVLSGNRTVSGKPILTSDPHLELSSPGIWYLARIEVPGLTLAGATAPGAPFLILGHNGRIAWGFTTAHSDTQDIFIEKLSPDDPGLYLTPEGPRPFEERKETITVKDSDAVELRIRATRHGPVLNDILGQGAVDLPGSQLLALAWPALRGDDLSAQALFRLNRAQSAGAAIEALGDFHAPHQNITIGDRAGRIAFIAPARIPIRKAGDGSRPVPGWSGDYDWLGYIPVEALPQRVDPDEGQIITANNRIVGEDYPYLLTSHWPPPYRAQRIASLLKSSGNSVEGSIAIQLDIVSGAAEALLPYLARGRFTDQRAAKFADRLAVWDRRMDRHKPEPLIFTAWMGLLNQAIFADELGEDYGRFSHPDPRRIIAALENQSAWCDNVTSEAREACPTLIGRALEQALTLARTRFGDDEKDWRWGAAHEVRFPHGFWDRVPFVGGRFGPRVEADGGDYTVNRGGARFNGPGDRLFEDIHGPGLRAVYDLADLDSSRFMIATGQSGNPLSSHYGDLAERWRDGEYLALPAGGSGQDVLRLIPE